MHFKDMKIKALKTALKLFNGDKGKVAEYLKISIRSVRNYCRHEPELRNWYIPRYVPRKELSTMFEKYLDEEEAYQALQKTLLWKFSGQKERKHFIELLEAHFSKLRRAG